MAPPFRRRKNKADDVLDYLKNRDEHSQDTPVNRYSTEISAIEVVLEDDYLQFTPPQKTSKLSTSASLTEESESPTKSSSSTVPSTPSTAGTGSPITPSQRPPATVYNSPSLIDKRRSFKQRFMDPNPTPESRKCGPFRGSKSRVRPQQSKEVENMDAPQRWSSPPGDRGRRSFSPQARTYEEPKELQYPRRCAPFGGKEGASKPRMLSPKLSSRGPPKGSPKGSPRSARSLSPGRRLLPGSAFSTSYVEEASDDLSGSVWHDVASQPKLLHRLEAQEQPRYSSPTRPRVDPLETPASPTCLRVGGKKFSKKSNAMLRKEERRRQQSQAPEASPLVTIEENEGQPSAVHVSHHWKRIISDLSVPMDDERDEEQRRMVLDKIRSLSRNRGPQENLHSELQALQKAIDESVQRSERRLARVGTSGRIESAVLSESTDTSSTFSQWLEGSSAGGSNMDHWFGATFGSNWGDFIFGSDDDPAWTIFRENDDESASSATESGASSWKEAVGPSRRQSTPPRPASLPTKQGWSARSKHVRPRETALRQEPPMFPLDEELSVDSIESSQFYTPGAQYANGLSMERQNIGADDFDTNWSAAQHTHTHPDARRGFTAVV